MNPNVKTQGGAEISSKMCNISSGGFGWRDSNYTRITPLTGNKKDAEKACSESTTRSRRKWDYIAAEGVDWTEDISIFWYRRTCLSLLWENHWDHSLAHRLPGAWVGRPTDLFSFKDKNNGEQWMRIVLASMRRALLSVFIYSVIVIMATAGGGTYGVFLPPCRNSEVHRRDSPRLLLGCKRYWFSQHDKWLQISFLTFCAIQIFFNRMCTLFLRLGIYKASSFRNRMR